MLQCAARQRTGKVLPWAIAVLVIVLACLTGYHYVHRDQVFSDAELLQGLQNAQLTAPAGPPVKPGEWPGWRGPRRDGISLETGLLTDWPESGPPVVWQAPTGKGYSSLAVAGGRVFTMIQEGENEIVLCWDADKGKELWRFPYPCRYDTDRNYGPWPRATPTVDGDFVYTVGGKGDFHCLRADSGAKIWWHDLLGEFGARIPQWGLACSPLIEGDLILVNPGGSGGNSVAAFNKRDGTLAWKALDDPAGYSSPIAVDLAGVRQVLFFTGTSLVSVSPKDGQLYWRFPWQTDHGVNVATPIIRGDYVFISSGYGKGCALLKIENDASGWQARPVYKHKRMCNHFGSSVLVGEHIYGFDDPNLLTCMEFRTGKGLWRERGFGKGTLLAADGHIIVLGDNGKLAVIEANPDGLRQKAAFQFSDKQCWTAPVLAHGKLYVRDEEKLVCYDLKKR